jgi:hypothetical protein
LKDVKVAIVGSEEKYWKPEQIVKVTLYIHDLLDIMSSSWIYGKVTLVSGRCPKGGIDIWAEIVANDLKLNKEIYPPKTNNWEGYKARNIQIAEACDKLFCIDPKSRGEKTGGKWTMRYAQKLGKPTSLVEIE